MSCALIWGAAGQPGVSHSQLLSWDGSRSLPGKGEVQEDLSTPYPLPHLNKSPFGLGSGQAQAEVLWGDRSAHTAWAAVPHLLWGEGALGQADTFPCSLGLACRPQLVSAKLTHPCCNCTENYLLLQDLYILISMVWCVMCGYKWAHSESSFCHCFEPLCP